MTTEFVIHDAAPADLPACEALDFLVVAPHPDDAELGLGGTISKMVDAGMRVGILDLTSGEPTPMGSEATRRAETIVASKAMRVTWRGNAGLPNRKLEHTLASRELIASYFRVLRPRWIFAPYWSDAHPDHVAATELVEAARFWAKLSKTDMPGDRFHPERVYNYFCIHLRLAIVPSAIIDISEHWDRKAAALAAYQSQFVLGKQDMRPSPLERFEVDARHWGHLIQRTHGEPIASKEPLALDSLSSLL
ncbi:MAG: PIG-L family deacetylase [Planctomycetota bacterium]